MKNLFLFSFLLISFLFMSNSSCKKDELDNLKAANFREDFEIGLGDTLTLPKSQREIGVVLESISDSRCPSDVQCVWAGNALVAVKVKSKSGAEIIRELCIGSCDLNPARSNSTQAVLDGVTYLITLKDVKPYPTQKDNANIKKIAVLTISKN